MAHGKHPSFQNGAEASDRKLEILVLRSERGEISEEEFFNALEELRLCSTMGPNSSAVYAIHYSQRYGYKRSVIRFIDEAKKRFPDSRVLAAALARFYAELGLYFLCRAQLKLVQPFENLRPEEAALLGELDRQVGRHISDCRHIDSHDHTALLAIDQAYWLFYRGEMEESIRAIRAVLADHPLWSLALEAKANLEFDCGKFQEAERSFGLALAIDASSAGALFGLIRLLVLLDRGEEAMPYLATFLKTKPKDSEYILLADSILFLQASGKLSEEVVQRLVLACENQDCGEAQIRKTAAILELRGDDVGAVRLLKKALAADPASFYCRFNLAALSQPREGRLGPCALDLKDCVPMHSWLEAPALPDLDQARLDYCLDAIWASLKKLAPSIIPGMLKVLVGFGDLQSAEQLINRLVMPSFPEYDYLVLAEIQDESLTEPRRLALKKLVNPALFNSEKRRGGPDHEMTDTWQISWEAASLPPFLSEGLRHAEALMKDFAFQEAAAAYKKLAETAPEEAFLLSAQAQALEAMGFEEDAETARTSLGQRFPAYFPVQIQAARGMATTGDIEAGLRILGGLLCHNYFRGEDFRELMKTIIDILIMEKNYGSALEWYWLWSQNEIDDTKVWPYRFLEDMGKGKKGPD